MAGSQNTCQGADLEGIMCGQVELDMGGLRGFLWKKRVQVGLHNLPVERQLEMPSAPGTERITQLCNVSGI